MNKIILTILLSTLLVSCELFEQSSFEYKIIYHFDESKGSSLINSAGDEDLNGTLYGVSRLVDGKVNSCISFSEGGYAIIPSLGVFENDEFFTDFWISFYEYPVNVEDTIQHIVGSGTMGLAFFRIESFNGHIVYSINDGIKWQEVVTSTQKILDNQWYYVAISYDGVNTNLYIDGVLDNSKNGSYPVQECHNRLYIGGVDYVWGGSYWLNQFFGRLDELRISDQSKTAEAILQYYDNTK